MKHEIAELGLTPILTQPNVDRLNERLRDLHQDGWSVEQVFSHREFFGVRWYASVRN